MKTMLLRRIYALLIICLSFTTFLRAQESGWKVNPYDFQYDMSLYVQMSIEGETVTELPLSEGQTVVYYDGLTIRELDTEVTFTLKQNGETVGKTLTFSANAYLYRMQTSENTAIANLVKALYAYGVSAKNYAG